MRVNEQLLLLYIGMDNTTAVLRFRIYSPYIITLLVKLLSIPLGSGPLVFLLVKAFKVFDFPECTR